MKRLLAKGVTDIEQTNGAGLTPLQAAACNGFDDVVDLLLEHGADMLATTYKGMTLLHFAGGSRGSHGRATGATMRRILETAKTDRRIRVNARAENGDTPLSRAVQTGTVDSVQQLLDSNADTSLRDAEGRSQLHHTTRLGMVEKSDMLIMHMTKSDIDAQDRDGETALHYVSGSGLCPLGTPMPQRLLRRVYIAERLISVGASVSLKNWMEETPYELAIGRGRLHVARVIETEVARRATLDAICMGLHPRLGANSHILELDPGVLRMITQEL